MARRSRSLRPCTIVASCCVSASAVDLLILLGPQAFQRGQLRIVFLIDLVLELPALFAVQPAPATPPPVRGVSAPQRLQCCVDSENVAAPTECAAYGIEVLNAAELPIVKSDAEQRCTNGCAFLSGMRPDMINTIQRALTPHVT